MLELALAEGVACKIEGLAGDFRFLSNFHPAPIEVDGLVFPTVEHAYQAAKTKDRNEKQFIAALPSPGSAKRHLISVRDDWEQLKLSVMETLVELKFHTHEELRQKLCATGTCCIEETNTWGDRFWGVSQGTGENHLGRILMRVRARLQSETTLPSSMNG